MSHSVDSIHLHPYMQSHQLFYLTIQLLFLIFTVVLVIRTTRDVMQMGLSFYFNVQCLIDLGLAASSTMLVTAFIWYSIALYDVADNVENMHFRHLFYVDRLLQAADGFVGFFAILRAVLLFRYIQIMDRVLVVLDKASPYVVCTVAFGMLIWLITALSVSALFGREVLQFGTLGSSMVATTYAFSRVFHYDTLHVSCPLAAFLFLMVCVLFFLCIARALCIVNLVWSWRFISELPPRQTTRMYFGQLAQNFKDAISCVGVKTKLKKKKKPAAIII